MDDIKSPFLEVGGKRFTWGARTYIMGIINLTEDSFSGDGLLSGKPGSEDYVQNALTQGRAFVEAGVDILDIGGESTRPGSVATPVEQELERVVPVIEAGARGFVTKSAAFSELASAIQAVSKGDSYLSPSTANALIEEYQHKSVSANGDKDPYQSLTEREREVLKLVVEGYTAKEIANMLCISIKTVEWHKGSLMNKLNIHNKTDLIKFALRKAIIEL